MNQSAILLNDLDVNFVGRGMPENNAEASTSYYKKFSGNSIS
jgi:hypothetical protein